MNVAGTFVLALIGGALWAAVSVYREHKISFTTIATPFVVPLVAWAILWVLNTWAYNPIQNQANGLAGKIQNSVNNAAPALVGPASGSDTVNNGPVFALPAGQSSDEPVITLAQPPTPILPPAIGEIRWVGSVHPDQNDPMIVDQVGCLSGQTLMASAMQGKLPSGIKQEVAATSNTLLQKPANEEWAVAYTFPSDQVSPLNLTVNGLDARALTSAAGGSLIIGQGNWPLVQATWDGVNYNVVHPVVCQYQ